MCTALVSSSNQPDVETAWRPRNNAVFIRTRLPNVHTSYYYFVVMYVRYRYIVDFHPVCSLRPFFSIPPTNNHPGSQSRLYNPLPACGLCLGFRLREEFSPSLHLLSLGGLNSWFDPLHFIVRIYCGNRYINAENRGDTQDHRGPFDERNRNQC